MTFVILKEVKWDTEKRSTDPGKFYESFQDFAPPFFEIWEDLFFPQEDSLFQSVFRSTNSRFLLLEVLNFDGEDQPIFLEEKSCTHKQKSDYTCKIMSRQITYVIALAFVLSLMASSASGNWFGKRGDRDDLFSLLLQQQPQRLMTRGFNMEPGYSGQASTAMDSLEQMLKRHSVKRREPSQY
ncbi:uncharacterized protein PoB_006256900 [Plakobranchus ocellatus]|uniref:Uncharacterized protein n=1 Tax=Plakobranchus ocellatus TaxID=259542 RepID=A0AAV4CVY8_9GAST|nr:uncharacterized protein PoB_006256900 [Plakobranchus ocellatus]